MMVNIELTPYEGEPDCKERLRSMAKDLTTHRKSVRVDSDDEVNRITTVFEFRDMPQGTAVSQIHKALKHAVWEGWEDFCISFGGR
ncbi:hypothetical protein NX722_25635 [Endozoicomonas gorgoniicola]|uniref:Uncharacterized protein n=1 Tax=Endozoicomonas gorgoniicola TaxID=1234144 RepID=A0ABT3N2U4_9GAMM|nr:hypothetical protein [Endozoicomonas gorgoniicola]MCW7555949.1 hypothetical protein [Endozoicomonas gorgoniicola]